MMRLKHFQHLRSLDLTWNFLVIFFYLGILKLQKLLKNFSNKSVSLNEFSSSDKHLKLLERNILLCYYFYFSQHFRHGKFYFNGMNESGQNAMPDSSWQVGIENLKHKQRLCCSWAAAHCSLTQQPGETTDRERQFIGL